MYACEHIYIHAHTQCTHNMYTHTSIYICIVIYIKKPWDLIKEGIHMGIKADISNSV